MFPPLSRAISETSKAAFFLFSIFVLLAGEAPLARAQSALDGFDPGAGGNFPFVNALAVQADGKILVGGSFTTLGGGGTGTTTRNYLGRLNPDGTLDTSFNPGADSTVNALAVQADGKILVGGTFTTLGGGGFGTTTRNKIGRLNPDGTLDSSFNPGANTAVNALAVQADGKILVSGTFTTLGGGGFGTITRNRIGRLNPDGSLDATFNPGADNHIFALAVQADGKILVSGIFTTIGGGGTGTTMRNRIGRLNPDGSVDTSFDPGANGNIDALAVQADGKILVVGYFTALGGGGTGTTTRNKIGRLNPDGTLDTSFDPGANNPVYALAVQADGKIVVGGQFTTLGGGGTGTTTRNNIGRLNPDGTLDTSFDPDPGANSFITALAVQADGKILVGGRFTTLRGGGPGTTPRNNIARLETDGRLDRTLNINLVIPPTGFVNAIAVQPDGKILIGGTFTAVLGVARNNIARLNSDGTLDTAFDPNANNEVDAIAVQADGKILVGGFFNQNIGAITIGGQTRNHIARLNGTNGLADSFNPNANNLVRSIAVQPDGKILVGGFFTSIGGATRNRIARLDATSGLADAFDPNANGNVFSITLQPDGKVLVGGSFNGANSIGGATRNRIARLDASSGLADTFDPNANGSVSSIALQTDGKILAGGAFNGANSIGGQTRNRIARLDPKTSLADSFDPNANDVVGSIAVQADGKILAGGFFNGANSIGGKTRNRIARLDAITGLPDAFDPNANNIVFSIGLQSDGKILAGGVFNGANSIGGQTRNYFARLSKDTPALQNLNVFNQGATWTLGGSSPQFTRATFEYSTDNITYGSAANGISNGSEWSFFALAFPYEQNFYIRARGYYRSGTCNGSESIMESVRTAFLSPLRPLQVVSRKMHGNAGPFDINLPLTGSPGIECRGGGVGNNYQMVLTFAAPAHFSSASVTSGTGSVSDISGSGTTTITVNLTGVTNAQRITVTLPLPSDGGPDVMVQMGVLVGDTNGSGAVNASDIGQTKTTTGQAIDASNFRADVDANGSINATDIALVKSKSGTGLP